MGGRSREAAGSGRRRRVVQPASASAASARTAFEQPQPAPAGEVDERRRDQDHPAQPHRHVEGPYAERQAAVARGSEAGDERGSGRQHRDIAGPLDQAGGDQRRPGSGEAAKGGAGRNHGHAAHQHAAVTDAIGDEAPQHARGKPDGGEGRDHPARRDQAQPELGPQRGHRSGQLADLEGGHDPGQRDRADRRPARTLRRKISRRTGARGGHGRRPRTRTGRRPAAHRRARRGPCRAMP